MIDCDFVSIHPKFLWFHLITFLTYCSLSSIFNFYLFVNFPDFFLLLTSGYFLLCLETMLCVISGLRNLYQDLIYGPIYKPPFRMFYVHFREKYVLLLNEGLGLGFYRYVRSYNVVQVFSILIFCLIVLSIIAFWDMEATNYYVKSLCFSFSSFNFCFIYFRVLLSVTQIIVTLCW